jgi:hypothetical protein
MANRVATFHPTRGRMSTLSTPSIAATPWNRSSSNSSSSSNQGDFNMPRSNCPPSRGGPRGGKDIIAVGTTQLSTALPVNPATAWTYNFDIAEDCRLARLNIQVTDSATGVILDSTTQLVTALTHNNDRLISGLQVGGALFDYMTQPGTNPVWGRYAVVSDQIIIQGTNLSNLVVIVTVTLSTM